MSNQVKSTVGVAEEAIVFDSEQPSRVREPMFEANPMQSEPDWLAMSRDIRRRFPKVMARLAE